LLNVAIFPTVLGCDPDQFTPDVLFCVQFPFPAAFVHTPLPAAIVPATYNRMYADVDSTAHDIPLLNAGNPEKLPIVTALKFVSVPSKYV